MEVIHILLRAALAIALIVALTRLNGLRSFSKMSSFDFAITVAMGSILASAVMAQEAPVFWTSLGALAAVFIVQRIISQVRTSSSAARKALDNAPLLLMRDGKILEGNLRKGRVSHSDLMGKLREANALRLQDVQAVILEDTGDVSVLHGDTPVDDCLLDGVRT